LPSSRISTIVIADLNRGAAHVTAQEITAHGGRTMAIGADASRVEHARSVAEQTMTALGRLDNGLPSVLPSTAPDWREPMTVMAPEACWEVASNQGKSKW
jgi:hypothetical protein